MPDPITIIGAAASVVTIVEVLAKTISTIHGLKGRWKDADIALLSLASQLTALKAALAKIREWMENAVEEMHYQLVMDLESSIKCCQILSSRLYEELAEVEKYSGGTLSTGGKANFVLKSSGMAELQNMIDRQTSALTLLLTACNRYADTQRRFKQ